MKKDGNKNNKHYGRCAICGKYDELSFEHIPPRSAFNSNPIKAITGDNLSKVIESEERMPWDFEGINYENMQRGLEKYSICKSCNNITGELYGEEYKKVAYAAAWALHNNKEKLKDNCYMQLKIEDVYISRFVKQVLSMFCSVYEVFTKKYSYVKDIILNKDKALEECNDFKIYAYLLKNATLGFSGATVIGYNNGETDNIVEIYAYPFGFILDLNPNKNRNEVELTQFLKYKYDEKFETTFYFQMHEKNIFFPLDYRSRKEIAECFK